MSDATYALHETDPFGTFARTARIARTVGEGLMWLGGGTLFAATIYLIIVLPGLFT